MVKNLPKIKTPFREISIADLMNCMFGLKGFETKTYFHIVNHGAVTVNELTKSFRRDRSTIQRALKNLAIAGLIYREQKNIMNGGYYYVYHAASFAEMKEAMKASFRKWGKAITVWIEELTPEIKNPP